MLVEREANTPHISSEYFKNKQHFDRFHLADMLELLDASSDSTDATQTYERTMQQLVEVTGMTGMALVLYAHDTYNMVSSSGLSDSLSQAIQEHPQEFSDMFKQAEHQTEPIFFYDINNHEFFPEIFRHKVNYLDEVWVPIRHSDILLGFLCMAKNDPGEWSNSDLAYFSAIGQLSGIIIYRALVAEKHHRDALAKERERIEARMRENIIQALGIAVIEEQLNHPADKTATSDDTERSSTPGILHSLTNREKDVLREVATGASNQEIAGKLFISTGTVKMTLQSIMRKLNVRNRVEAAVYAVEAGLGPSA